MSQRSEDLSFSIDSRLLEELGENLVTRNHVAVAELIKNSYDADATKVELYFQNARQNSDGQESEIRIVDNGSGMTYEEIDKNWMRIGTTDKIRNPRTDVYGRQKTGNKGIGRFSCRRLGNKLELSAVAEDPESDQYIKTDVKFPWSEFERESDVDKIPVESEVEYLDEANTGVELRISDLRDEWTQRDFNTLRRNVLTLSVVEQQRREGYQEDPGFDIDFHAPEFDKGEGTLAEQVYQSGWCNLTGRFTEEGDVELTIEAKKIGERSYTIKKGYSGVENTKFKIAFIPKKKEHFRDPNTLSLEKARDLTSEYGGIRVYQEGFRVYPYGGPDDDWLGIDRYYSRRVGSPDEEFEEISGDLNLHDDFSRTMLSHPRNENLIGRISVPSEANLKMKTDREGYIQNDSFEDLKSGVRLALQWLTLQYSNYQALLEKEEFEEKANDLLDSMSGSGGSDSNGQSSSSSSSSLDDFGTGDTSGDSSSESTGTGSASRGTTGAASDMETVNQAVSVIQQASNKVSRERDDEDEISEAVETASDIVQHSIEKNRKEIAFYRSAFSVNQFIFSFMHELRDIILDLENAETELDTVANSMGSDHSDDLTQVSDDISGIKDRFEQQMNLFGILTDTNRDSNVTDHRLEKEIGELLDSVEYISEEYDIETRVDIPGNLYTPSMHQTELYSVLINLVTNSIKAVIANNDGRKEILVEAEKNGQDVVLRVHDSGIGIPPEYEDEVLEPLVSDPEDTLYDSLSDAMPNQLSSQLGSGSGLGLSIVSDIAAKYEGQVQFIDDPDWSTSAEVTLRDD